jgi:serine/threonine protein kinase
MQFIKTYKDNNNIYFLVEYVKGIELFDVIRDIGNKTTLINPLILKVYWALMIHNFTLAQ